MRIEQLRVFVVGNPPPSFGGRYFVFLQLTTDDGIVGVGEVYAATFHPSRRRADDRGRLRAPRRRPRPVPRSRRSGGASTRAATPPGPTSRWSACSAGSRWRAGTSSARRSASRSTSCSAAACTSGCAPTRTSNPGRRPRPTSTRSGAGGRAGRRVRGARLHGAQVRPRRPYSAFDPRQPALDGARALGAYVRGRARGGRRAAATCCSAPTASSRRPARSGWPARLEPFDPLWLEEPVPPDCPEEMATVARATTIPIATGERLTTKYEFARVLATGAASILQLNLGRGRRPARGQEDRGMAEAHYAQIAPHLYCGPVVGRGQHPARGVQPQLPDPRGDPRLGRLPRRDPAAADRAGRTAT